MPLEFPEWREPPAPEPRSSGAGFPAARASTRSCFAEFLVASRGTPIAPQWHQERRSKSFDPPKEGDIDLIVMGTHGRGFVAHAVMGSVAEKVVRAAPCPVLTVHNAEHEFVIPEDVVQSEVRAL